jgi:hypothetical protein
VAIVKAKENRIARELLEELVVEMIDVLSEEDRDKFKRALVGKVMRLDRVSTPEAMEYVDKLLKEVSCARDASIQLRAEHAKNMRDAPGDPSLPRPYQQQKARAKHAKKLNGGRRLNGGKSLTSHLLVANSPR